MRSSLLIAYPHIQYDALDIASTGTWGEIDWPLSNTLGGRRYDHGCLLMGSTFNLEYDLGSGNSSACEYAIISHAKYLIDRGYSAFSISTAADGIGGTYSVQYNDVSFASSSLYGPCSNDYLVTGLNISASRTYKVDLTNTGIGSDWVGKIYLGTFFDFGVEPFVETNLVFPENQIFRTTSGVVIPLKTDWPRYHVAATWCGVTDAKVSAFYAVLERIINGKNHFFLVTDSNHEQMKSLRVLHVQLDSYSISKNTMSNDYHDVSIQCSESLGGFGA